MYKLPYFTEVDTEKIIAMMKENSFAVVIGSEDEYPVASHLPLNLEQREGKLFLTGHLMKNTDHHKAFEKNEKVLVVFNGPHTYVSASWYTKQDVASTWNYMTVHAKGKIKFTDEAGTHKAIKAITDKYEGQNSHASFNKLPEEYVSKLMKAIVGFEIEVLEVENVFKLSQNHNIETRKSIIAHLLQKADEPSENIAKEMMKRLSE